MHGAPETGWLRVRLDAHMPAFGHRPQEGTAAIPVTPGAPAHPIIYTQPQVARCVHNLNGGIG
jgi:hypothetical protein